VDKIASILLCLLAGIAYLIIAIDQWADGNSVGDAWNDPYLLTGLACFVAGGIGVAVILVARRKEKWLLIPVVLLLVGMLSEAVSEDRHEKKGYSDGQIQYVKQIQDRYGVDIVGSKAEARFCLNGEYLLVADPSTDQSALGQTVHLYDPNRKEVFAETLGDMLEQLKIEFDHSDQVQAVWLKIKPASPRNHGYMQIAVRDRPEGRTSGIFYYNLAAAPEGKIALKITD
jgi:hypothetical protein